MRGAGPGGRGGGRWTGKEGQVGEKTILLHVLEIVADLTLFLSLLSSCQECGLARLQLSLHAQVLCCQLHWWKAGRVSMLQPLQMVLLAEMSPNQC